MIQATIIKSQNPDPYYCLKPWTREEQVIEAESEDELLAMFFRDYDNRYKYANSINYRFKDEEWVERYRKWISDVNNYARNGGDMW